MKASIVSRYKGILQAYLAAKALIISLLKLWWSLNGEIVWRIHERIVAVIVDEAHKWYDN